MKIVSSFKGRGLTTRDHAETIIHIEAGNLASMAENNIMILESASEYSLKADVRSNEQSNYISASEML